MEDIKKILIKMPRRIEDVMASFPFVVAVTEEFPSAEINIVAEEETGWPLGFIPHDIYLYERPKNKLSLLETHHFCANTHNVFNIDLFLDLESSLNSSFMGLNFRCKERVGYENGRMNKFFLTKKYPLPLGVEAEKKAMKLLELYLERDFPDFRIAKAIEKGQEVESIEKLFKEPEAPNFILIMLDSFLEVSHEVELWKSFFDSFENQKFIIWSNQDEDAIDDLFSSIDLGKNELFIHRGKHIGELIYIFSKVKGVVVNNELAERICSYVGIESLTFYQENKFVPSKYEYFKYRPQRFIFRLDKTIAFQVWEEELPMADINQVVDRLHQIFKL